MAVACGCFRRILTPAIGILQILIGVYLYINWIEMFTQLRGKEMALSPTSPSYSGWKVSPLPLYFDVYLFNWTNPEEYFTGSKVKPNFKQLGPYRFREIPDKVDIEWHTHNSSVSFRKQAFFYFDAAGSNGKLDDRITSVNTVAHAAALQGKNAGVLQKYFIDRALGIYNGVSITKSAEEWMFAGYQDPLVTMGSFVSHFTSDFKVPYDRVGWMYTRNGSATYDGHFNMYTGADDIYKMGRIHTWNYRTQTDGFPSSCGDVFGSMGEFFPANLSPNQSVSIFLPNLCRAVPLDYSETVQIHGVTAYKYSGGEQSVDNGTTYPNTKCLCINDKCEAAGVINISRCKFNSSIYMSYPHFYKADPIYAAAVNGMSPDPAKHEFYITIEPNAGVVMDVGGGFQANYLLEPVKSFKLFNNIPRTFIPLMWCEERVRVTPEIASEIALVPLIVLLGQIVTGALLASGVIMFFWYPAKIFSQLCKDPKKKTILLRSLSDGPRVITTSSITTAMPLRKSYNLGQPLLELSNGTYTRSIGVNDSITESLLTEAVRLQNDAIR